MQAHVVVLDQVSVTRVDFERYRPGVRRYGGRRSLEQFPLRDIEVFTASRVRAILGPQDDDTGRCAAQKTPLHLPLAFGTQGHTLVEDGIGHKQRPLGMQVIPPADQAVEIVVVEHNGILLEAIEVTAAVEQEEPVRVLFRFVVKNEFR